MWHAQIEMEQNKQETGLQEAGPRGVGGSQNPGGSNDQGAAAVAGGGGAFILNLNIDVVLIIFSLLLKYNFTDFANFFITWAYSHTQDEIIFILENLDWTKMDVRREPWHHTWVNCWDHSAYTKFFGFLQHCKRKEIKQAFFYDASRHLLKREETENNLNILQQLSINHSPSILGFYVFKSIYEPIYIEQCATAIHNHLKIFHHRADLRWLVKMLRNLNKSEKIQRYTPDVGGICPQGKLRLSNHFYIQGWPPTFEDIINSTCPLCCIQMIWCMIFDEYCE